MLITNDTIASLNKTLVTRYNAAARAVTPQYQKVASRVSSTTAGNVYGFLGTFPALKRFTGESKIQSLDSSDYTILNEEWDVTIGIPRKDVERDQLASHSMAVGGLGRRGAQLPDTLVFGLLNDGFSAKDYTGTAFFADSKKHSGRKGATFDNKDTAALADASLKAAIAQLRGMKDAEGQPINEGLPLILVVPPALEFTARQLVSTTTVQQGGQNVLAGAAEVVVSAHLSSATAWFLIAHDEFAPALIYQEEVAPGITALTNPQSEHLLLQKEFLYNCYGRGQAGYGFPQKAFGSTGAA